MEKEKGEYLKPIISQEEYSEIKTFLKFLSEKNLKYDQEKNNDAVIIRFLRARKFDHKKTFEMFRNYLEWREKNKVDEIFSYDFPEFPEIKKNYPMGFHKTDKQGRPIYFEITGQMNLEQIFKHSSTERMLKHQIRQFEYVTNFMLPACSKKIGKNVSQTLNIMDLRKETTKFMSKKVLEFIKNILGISQNYYPEILGNLFVINTGMTFKILWTAVKPFMDEKTKKKITTLGSDYKKKLLEFIDEENLPVLLGGKSIFDPNENVNEYEGPWNNYEDDNTKKIKFCERADLTYKLKNSLGLVENSKDDLIKKENVKESSDNNNINDENNHNWNFNDVDIDNIDDKEFNNEFENQKID